MLSRAFMALALMLMAYADADAQVPHRYDVVIDEFLTDPAPVVALPNASFVELKNLSATAFHLMNWKIGNGSNAATIKTDLILKPDSFVIVCPVSAMDSYNKYGSVIGVSSFPSLAKNGGLLELIAPGGGIIHVIQYDRSWYQNAVAEDGGWSLEMIDPKYPCTGYQNWIASHDPTGGTPGRRNSADAPNADQRPPALLRSFATDPTHVTLIFDEPLDSATAGHASYYEIDNSIGRAYRSYPQAPVFNQVQLQFNQPLNPGQAYQVTVHSVTDCSGNEIGGFNTAKTGLAIEPDTQDIVINEIMFNPPSYGYDYVEFYNRSQRVFDLNHLYLASRGLNGDPADPKMLNPYTLLFFPGEYYVVTENGAWVTQQYSVQTPAHLLTIPQLPSMPDDNGRIVLLNAAGTFIDALDYDHSWHFSLITNEEGVALERLSSSLPTQDQSNWSSAASTAKYGTPTARNSQSAESNTSAAELTVTPKIFSPDNDGNDDYCFIHYHLPEAGYVANVLIFDANGRTVRKLNQNSTLAQEGSFRWDGLDDAQRRLPVGNYIIYVELFNGGGIVKKFREVVTLAVKL